MSTISSAASHLTQHFGTFRTARFNSPISRNAEISDLSSCVSYISYLTDNFDCAYRFLLTLQFPVNFTEHCVHCANPHFSFNQETNIINECVF